MRFAFRPRAPATSPTASAASLAVFARMFMRCITKGTISFGSSQTSSFASTASLKAFMRRRLNWAIAARSLTGSPVVWSGGDVAKRRLQKLPGVLDGSSAGS